MGDHLPHPDQSPKPLRTEKRPVTKYIEDSDVQVVTDSEVQKILSVAKKGHKHSQGQTVPTVRFRLSRIQKMKGTL